MDHIEVILLHIAGKKKNKKPNYICNSLKKNTGKKYPVIYPILNYPSCYRYFIFHVGKTIFCGTTK